MTIVRLGADVVSPAARQFFFIYIYLNQKIREGQEHVPRLETTAPIRLADRNHAHYPSRQRTILKKKDGSMTDFRHTQIDPHGSHRKMLFILTPFFLQYIYIYIYTHTHMNLEPIFSIMATQCIWWTVNKEHGGKETDWNQWGRGKVCVYPVALDWKHEYWVW